ncbi:hypothetical protein KBD81_02830 [Candidatus Woesebacteria bacterium]|nr:hypothetical protein [Candidatus Woesebacteria bacterium]
MASKKHLTEKLETHDGIRMDETVVVEDIEPTIEIDKKELLFEALLNERAEQRKQMMSLVITLSYLSFGILALIIIAQGVIRILTSRESFLILDNYQFNIVAVYIFGQMVGVMIIIVKLLFDDKKYLDKL